LALASLEMMGGAYTDEVEAMLSSRITTDT
jgi:hypothetical protein